MAIRNIILEGDPMLRKKSKPVREVNDHIRETMQDMLETMHQHDGVGLAAPQVGVMRRMFVAEPYPDEVYYMINPEITYTEGTQESSEGCLSVPGLMGLVDRPMKIRIKALDLEGKEHEYEFEGFEATVFCHEYDHLEGILYPDIAKDLMTTEEYADRLEELRELHESDEGGDSMEIWEGRK